MRLTEQKTAPSTAQMALLLEGDPDPDKLAAYLKKSSLYVSDAGDGLVVLMPLPENNLGENNLWEIKNIALAKSARGQGRGKKLLQAALDVLALQGALAVEIGTGNSSLAQLALYQKMGFRIIAIWPDFFADYPQPIIENGILCRDMVRLRWTKPKITLQQSHE